MKIWNNVAGERDFYAAWILLLEDLLKGDVVHPRGKCCRENFGVQFYVENSLANIIIDPQRKLNYRFMVAQWLTTFLGLEDLPILENYNKAIASYETDGQGGTYPSYGPRLHAQWPFVFKSLRDDLDSRQAVMSIWERQVPNNTEPNQQEYITKYYVPCTLNLQFLVRGNRLHTIISMRSSDAWLGLPYDFFNFTMLANYLASNLSYEKRRLIAPGSITINMGSSHLYETNWATAASIVNAPSGASGLSPRIPGSAYYPQALQDVLEAKHSAQDLPPMSWPWIGYANILIANTNAEALELLKHVGRTHAEIS